MMSLYRGPDKDAVRVSRDSLPDMKHARGYCTGCALPDGRFAVLGGRSHRSSAQSGRRDGEVYCPRVRVWRMLPALPVLFRGLEDCRVQLTVCAAGRSLLVA